MSEAATSTPKPKKSVALSGVEAVSNGVPAFRRSESRNAAITIAVMGGILGSCFLGVSILAAHLKPYRGELDRELRVEGVLAGGQAADIAIAAKEILRWRRTLNEAIARHTGKSPEQIEKDSDRDYYMSAEEAKAYGMIDEVLTRKK